MPGNLARESGRRVPDQAQAREMEDRPILREVQMACDARAGGDDVAGQHVGGGLTPDRSHDLGKAGQVIQLNRRTALAQVIARTLAPLDDMGRGKVRESAAQRRARHPDLVAKLPLGREGIPRPHVAGDDMVQDSLDGLVVRRDLDALSHAEHLRSSRRMPP